MQTVKKSTLFYEIIFYFTCSVIFFKTANALCIETYLLQDLQCTDFIEIKTAIASIWRCRHIVYRDKADFYYKIWGLTDNFETQNYVQRCQDFMNAFNKGIFNDISPLHGLIFHEGLCCGYITRKCSIVNKNSIKWIDYGAGCRIELVDNQPSQIIDLWEKLLKIYEMHDYMFMDMHIDNLVEENNKFLLIDLDDFFEEKTIPSHIFDWVNAGHIMYNFYKTLFKAPVRALRTYPKIELSQYKLALVDSKIQTTTYR